MRPRSLLQWIRWLLKRGYNTSTYSDMYTVLIFTTLTLPIETGQHRWKQYTTRTKIAEFCADPTVSLNIRMTRELWELYRHCLRNNQKVSGKLNSFKVVSRFISRFPITLSSFDFSVIMSDDRRYTREDGISAPNLTESNETDGTVIAQIRSTINDRPDDGSEGESPRYYDDVSLMH